MNTQFVATLTVEELRAVISEEVQKTILKHTPPPPEVFLSPKEACKLLGITLTTLATYTKQGRLIDHRVPGTRTILYKKSEIMSALVSLKKYKPVQAA